MGGAAQIKLDDLLGSVNGGFHSIKKLQKIDRARFPQNNVVDETTEYDPQNRFFMGTVHELVSRRRRRVVPVRNEPVLEEGI
jgi:hypothetical protein